MMAVEHDLAPRPERKIHIVQGEHCVSDDADVVFSTILGSCVAACMRDRVAGIGGMNHFLLPGQDPSRPDVDSMRYGVHAMELLVNAMLRQGARRERLEAKLFGGANLMRGMTDVGAMNSAFAEDFLRREGIQNIGGSLLGTKGRRIQFWPVSGRARQAFLGDEGRVAFDLERNVKPTERPASSGALELF
jgi:chemotaxis protein CheD